MHLGQYEDAIASYNQALKIDPDNPSPWYNKACAYALSHHTDKALTCLQTAIQLSGTDEYIALAKTESDFDSLREHPSFQAIITQS